MPLVYFERRKRRDPDFTWEQVVLYKMDLKGAFTLLSLSPPDVHYMGIELVSGLVLIFLCGIFGWTSTPGYFNVLSRAIVWELRILVAGLLVMYVDDITGCCGLNELTDELATVKGVCEGLLGLGAIEPSKTESGRRLQVIGYIIDLDTQLVTIAEKNVLRAIYGFLSIRLDEPVMVKTMQRLASWGTRYSGVCVFMRPFVRALYNCYVGRSEHVSFMVTIDAARSVRLFRVLLLLVVVEEKRFARQLSSFRPGTWTGWVIEFDASLTGIGVIIYQRDRAGSEVPVGYCVVDIASLGFAGNPAYQNTAEFIGATLGMRVAFCVGAQMDSICLRGDSVTALRWAVTSRFRSHLVAQASMVFVIQQIQLEASVGEVIHISSDENWRADELTRGG
jgi:hypothetical protein